MLVRDFRSIAGEWEIPLDAGVVLIHGQNGSGKTSLLSALELAATGKISYLDHIGDGDYLSHLHHRGKTSGQVTLQTAGLADRNVGTAHVAAAGADAQPLLDDRLSDAFVERCFLPQATLGRLFEVYAPRGNNDGETPLIRFVKEMLGLDSLDALIDGLYASGHVRRIEKLSPAWQRADDRTGELDRVRRTAASTQAAAQRKVGDLVDELALRLRLDDGVRSRDAIAASIAQLVSAQLEEDAEASRLHEAQLRLDAVEAMLAQNELSGADPNQPPVRAALEKAEARLHVWESSRAAPLLEWFEGGERRSDKMEEIGLATVLSAVRRAIQETERLLADAQRRTALAREYTDMKATTGERMEEVLRSLEKLSSERNAASTSSAAAGLASLLVSVIEHVDGDLCPVCDQPFLTGGSLREHIVSKAERLDADAGRLLQLETLRASLDNERAVLVDTLAQLEARTEELTSLDAVASVERSQNQQLGELRALEAIGESGLLLENEVVRLRDEAAKADRNRTLLESCIYDLNDVARMLRAEPPGGLIAQRIASLRATARAGLDLFESGQRRLAEIVRLHESLDEAAVRLSIVNEQVAAAQREVDALTLELDEAKRRKEVASGLRKQAETVRAATINRVFDQRLNGSWARIFGALVPSEPFIPQFRKFPEGSRQLAVQIETVHRDGLEGATPAAMLSQGNLNTAALSLFVAMHFAVPAELPWLLFDDPVQSMDDLHVSNFAALVKQLTRRNGRQVVIAVHERELFDYLALELTPASPDEELLTVILDRTYGKSVVASQRVLFRQDTAVMASPAA